MKKYGMDETKPKKGYLVLQKVSEAFKVIRLVRLPVILNLLFVRNIINMPSYFIFMFVPTFKIRLEEK